MTRSFYSAWLLCGALFVEGAMAAAASDVAPLPGIAPFGDQIAEQRLPLYHRVAPRVATSGPIEDEGVIEAKRVGFATIVDLRPAADIASEKQHAEFARIRYVNIPLNDLPTKEQVGQFAALLADRESLPLLLHGANTDHAGAMWALYRASLGVPPNLALDDGITAGLQDSTEAVRTRLAEKSKP
jgi:protein tyrosine phosphatase (PTP) superfamily phosphohydrolase (DUF442 family)